MLTVEIGIEGSKSRTRALKVLTAMNDGVGLMEFHGGLGLGLVTPQSSQFQPAIPSLQVLPTQVGPILYVPAGGFTLPSHFTLRV